MGFHEISWDMIGTYHGNSVNKYLVRDGDPPWLNQFDDGHWIGDIIPKVPFQSSELLNCPQVHHGIWWDFYWFYWVYHPISMAYKQTTFNFKSGGLSRNSLTLKVGELCCFFLCQNWWHVADLEQQRSPMVSSKSPFFSRSVYEPILPCKRFHPSVRLASRCDEDFRPWRTVKKGTHRTWKGNGSICYTLGN